VQLSRLVEQLTVQLGRSPTISELAKAAGTEEEEVLEALESGRAYSSLSLSSGGGQEDGEELDPLESIGTEEHQYDVSEDRAVLVGIDQSQAMVEIQRAQGIEARVGDVQALPFADGEFDLVVAAWMLYHVPDLDRGLAEIARVLRPGGVLVAATNSLQHMEELWALAQRDRPAHARTFRSENGDAALRRHFAKVARRDARGTVTLDDAAIRRFGASWGPLGSLATMPPLEGPLL